MREALDRLAKKRRYTISPATPTTANTAPCPEVSTCSVKKAIASLRSLGFRLSRYVCRKASVNGTHWMVVRCS